MRGLLADAHADAHLAALEATIRADATVHSLPVLTIAKADEFLKKRSYAELAAIRLFEILFDLEKYRGTGRLFLPEEFR